MLCVPFLTHKVGDGIQRQNYMEYNPTSSDELYEENKLQELENAELTAIEKDQMEADRLKLERDMADGDAAEKSERPDLGDFINDELNDR